MAECSDRKGYKAIDKKAIDEEETSREVSIANKDSKEMKRRPVKRRFSVTESLASIQEEMKKENETRMQKMEEMHKEKMQHLCLICMKETFLQKNNNLILQICTC